MGDATVNGPTQVEQSANSLGLFAHGRHLGVSPNGVLCVSYRDSDAASMEIATSADGGETWNTSPAGGDASLATQTANDDGKGVNPALALSGDNRVAITYLPTMDDDTHVVLFSISSDGTLTQQSDNDVGGTLDINSGQSALACDSADTFWLVNHFTSATNSNYGIEIRNESQGSFGTQIASGHQSDDPNRFDVAVGPNDDLHIAWNSRANGSVQYQTFDTSAETFGTAETVTSSDPGNSSGCTIAFNENDEPVVAVMGAATTGLSSVFHRNAGTWEATSFTSDTPGEGGIACTYPNFGGDGDVAVVYYVDSADEIRAAYGRLDENSVGSAIRAEDALVAESDTVDGPVVGYQYRHTSVVDDDELDCLYVDGNGTDDNRLMYFSAPTPLTPVTSTETATQEEPGITTDGSVTTSVSSESTTNIEPSISTTPGAATQIMAAATPTAAEPSPTMEVTGEIVANMSIESVEQVELQGIIVYASGAVAASSANQKAEEYPIEISVGGLTRNMAVGSVLTTEPSPDIPSSFYVNATSDAASTIEPSILTQPGLATSNLSTSQLNAFEPHISVSGGPIEPEDFEFVFDVGGKFGTEASIDGKFDSEVSVLGKFIVEQDATGEFTTVYDLSGRFLTVYSVDGEADP